MSEVPLYMLVAMRLGLQSLLTDIKDKRSSWEQSVTGQRTGSRKMRVPPVPNSKMGPFDNSTKSSPIGREEVAAARKGLGITPGGTTKWRRAAAASRWLPTMNKSPQKICPGHAF